MNRIFTLLLFFLATTSFGQQFQFSLEVLTEQEYASIEGTNIDLSSNPDFVNFPIGFDFKYLTSTYSEMYLFGDLVELFAPIFVNETGETGYVIIPYYTNFYDFEDNPLTKFSYQTTGEPGSRILKMQWSDAYIWGGDDVYDQKISYQVWLYEESNIIEYHYGPSNTSISDNYNLDDGYPLTGFYDGYDSDNAEIWLLTDEPNNPYIQFFQENNDVPVPLNSTPSEGMVYRFSPSTTDINKVDSSISIKIFPTICSTELSIINDLNLENNYSYSIINNLGIELITNEKLISNKIGISNIPSGFYYLQLIKDERIIGISKFVKD